jgi:hypothetical protein
MKFSVTGQVKGDLLIQVTAWTGLTVCGQYVLLDYKCMRTICLCGLRV